MCETGERGGRPVILILFGLWLLLNGRWTTEIAVTGAVLSAGIWLFSCAFLGLSPKKEIRAAKQIPRFISYLFFLLGEIIKASLSTMKLIWAPNLEAEPKLKAFRTALRTRKGKVMLAQSITLTPGTITVDYMESEFLVHCLDEDFAEGLEHSRMEEKILEMEGGGEQ